MAIKNRLLKMHPAVLVLASFLLAIALGASLLMLPFSSRYARLPLMDALFTATSAVCVTGLVVVDTGTYFTIFGQTIILVLIQIGGLGVMTISVMLFQWLGKSISIRQRMAMQDVFSHTPRHDIIDLVKTVILFTIGAEAIGTLVLTLQWSKVFPLSKAFYFALFHSVSAFCNAGFALFADSLVGYSDQMMIVGTVGVLIVIGGIGFPVLYDLQSRLLTPRSRTRLTVQTKTVLLTTFILIAGGAAMVAALEYPTHPEPRSWSHITLTAVFQSITCRTAGFNTIDIASLHEATLAVMIFLMFFGASPGSCGGGVKTTTLALLVAFAFSRITRKRRVNLFKKSIPTETINRSMSLILLSTGIITVIIFMLLVSDVATGRDVAGHRGAFLAYVFETVSAFGTVGLSMGVTPLLSNWSKLWIILAMIIGRVGVLTFSYIITGGSAAGGKEYAEQNLMIG